jgi:hypothetical protein
MTDPDRLATIEEHLTDHQDIHEDDGRWLLGKLKEWQLAAGAEADLADERGREVERLRGLLARLEWVGVLYPEGAADPCCPACGEPAPEVLRSTGKHDPGCWLVVELHPERETTRPVPREG